MAERMDILIVTGNEKEKSFVRNLVPGTKCKLLWFASSLDEFKTNIKDRDLGFIIYFFIEGFDYIKAWELAKQRTSTSIVISENDFPFSLYQHLQGLIITDKEGVRNLFSSELPDLQQSSEHNETIQLKNVLENIPNGIICLNRQWEVTYINRIAEEFLRRPSGYLKGKNIWKEFPGAEEGITYTSYHKALETNEPITIEDYSPTLGRYIQSSVLSTPEGLVIYFYDLTRQRSVEQGLKESEDKYRILLDRITDGFIALDKDFNYTYANQKIGRMLKRDPALLIGKNVWEEFPDAVGSYTYKAFHTAMKEQRFISIVDYYKPLNLWQENYIYPSSNGLSVFIKDVSEQKKLQRELNERERKQQLEIIANSQEAQEKERTFIGRELHDNVNQIITATKLLLVLLRDNPDKHRDLIFPCISNLDMVIEENRKLAHSLVTPDFRSGNFIEELSSLVLPMMESKGIHTRVETINYRESMINDITKLTAYRIAQEQCTNIIKYAKAINVRILLQTSERHFEMEIFDDGVGMNSTDKGNGIGIRNIEGRLKVLNGKLEIKTAPGKGFLLKIAVPLTENGTKS